MQFKPITAIIVLLLVVVSLSVASCTTSNTSNTNQTPSASEATHNATLEKYLNAYKNNQTSNKNSQIKAWEVTWTNSTSARVEFAVYNQTTNSTANVVDLFTVFPTTQDATNYLNAMNRTAYSLASTQYVGGGAYQNATGQAPQVYKDYVWNEGNPFNIPEYTRHEIVQLDNIIAIYTAKVLS
jgi:hypothetical protein